MKSADLLQTLQDNPFVLAPMAGITDCAFRSFMKSLGAGVLVTELISANGLDYESERTKKLMDFTAEQHPIGIQLFGEDPEVLGRAAKMAEQTGCDFIDLNFGCPVPKVTKKGAGSAALRDLPNLGRILSSVKKAVSIPVTIKIRTGWDASSRNSLDVCNLAHSEGMTWVAVHGRTRAQNYEGRADWDYIRQLKADAPLPVLGNGDIITAQQAVDRLAQSRCDGVLIGRGCLKDPLLLKKSLHLLRNMESKLELNLHETYLSLSENIKTHCDERIIEIQLKKFAAWFSTGYPGASLFRKTIFQLKNCEEILDFSLDYFHQIDLEIEKQSNNGESGTNLDSNRIVLNNYGFGESQFERKNDDNFLMGGHG